MRARTALTGFGAIALSMGSFFLVAAAPVEDGAQQGGAARQHWRCQDLQPDLELRMDASAVIATDDGDALDVDVEITSNIEKQVTVSYASALWDDRGTNLSAETPRILSSLRARSPAATTIRIPPRLKDGFYRLQLVAAAMDADGTSRTSENSYYVEVSQRQIIPLSSAEWRARSNYMVANAMQPTDKVRGLKPEFRSVGASAAARTE